MTILDLLGQICELTVIRTTGNGAYLAPTDDPSLQILLPNNQLREHTAAGDVYSVFIYKDSEDRPIATTATPRLTLGSLARCIVKEVTDIGAFLDWGLTKDLFLPFKEQTARVRTGQSILVALYIDKSERLCATTHLYHYLSSDSSYKKNDHVTGYLYEITESYGAFVAIDDQYAGLIPHNEMNRLFRIGENLKARVKEVRPDGKLTLSLSETVDLQMDKDSDLIYQKLQAAGGFLPFHDKTSPEIIKREFQISKNAFKRALGRLMKTGKIKITDKGIVIPS